MTLVVTLIVTFWPVNWTVPKIYHSLYPLLELNDDHTSEALNTKHQGVVTHPGVKPRLPSQSTWSYLMGVKVC